MWMFIPSISLCFSCSREDIHRLHADVAALRALYAHLIPLGAPRHGDLSTRKCSVDSITDVARQLVNRFTVEQFFVRQELFYVRSNSSYAFLLPSRIFDRCCLIWIYVYGQFYFVDDLECYKFNDLLYVSLFCLQ